MMNENLLNLIISIVSILVNILIVRWDWTRRPAVHWFVISLSDVDGNDLEIHRFADGNRVSFNGSCSISTESMLVNNGELQANGVKFYAYKCDMQIM